MKSMNFSGLRTVARRLWSSSSRKLSTTGSFGSAALIRRADVDIIEVQVKKTSIAEIVAMRKMRRFKKFEKHIKSNLNTCN